MTLSQWLFVFVALGPGGLGFETVGFPPFHKGIQSEPPKPLAETLLFDDFLLKLCEPVAGHDRCCYTHHCLDSVRGLGRSGVWEGRPCFFNLQNWGYLDVSGS